MSLKAIDTCTTATFTDLNTAIAGCETFTASLAGKVCMVNPDLKAATEDTEFKCVESVIANKYVLPGDVTINGSKAAKSLQGATVKTATDEAINNQLCLVYGAYYGARDGSFWTVEQAENKCKEAYVDDNSCTTVADFTTIHALVGSGTSDEFLAICDKMRFNDATPQTRRCSKPASGTTCGLDAEPSCAYTNNAASELDTLISDCSTGKWTVREETKCLINHDQSSSADQCREYLLTEEVQATSVGFDSTTVGDHTRCFLLQQEFDSLAGNDTTGWMARDGGVGCEEATACKEIKFEDWSGVSTTKPVGGLCNGLIDKNATECDGEVDALICSEKEIVMGDCGSTTFNTVKGALAGCGDGSIVNLPVGPKVCAMSNDLSTSAYEDGVIQCHEYDSEEEMKTEFNGISMSGDNEIRNNVVCLSTGMMLYDDSSTNAFISDSTTTCVAAKNCEEIIYGSENQNYDGTGYTAESFASDFPCADFKIDDISCIPDPTAFRCTSPPVCASLTSLPNDTTLVGAITACGLAIPDVPGTNECRVNENLTNVNYSCENKPIATSMLAADVKVADSESSDAICAVMGYRYGEEKVNAWNRNGGVCEAIVLEGTCDQVTWKGYDADVLGEVTNANWQDVCTTIGHLGYTNTDGTEGLVTCAYKEGAEACSPAVALVVGVLGFLFTLFY